MLALAGIAGVTAWSVAERTREIGIRMALGAQRNEVLVLVLRYGLTVTLTGLSCGMIAWFFLRRILTSFVYGVSTADPAIYVCVSALVLISGELACFVPVRKAAAIDPLVSLRHS